VGGAVPKFLLERPKPTAEDLEGKTEEEQDMLKVMGFAVFDTTKVFMINCTLKSSLNLL